MLLSKGQPTFQLKLAFALALSFAANGYINYQFSYLELLPQVTCAEVEDCTWDQICTDNLEYSIDYTNSRTSLHNWVEQLDLYCATDQQIGWIAGAWSLGWAVALLFIPTAAEVYGRKPIVVASSLMVAISILCTFFVRKLGKMYAVMFMFGFACSGRDPLAIVYGSEFMTSKQQVSLAAFVMFVDQLSVFVISLYYMFIGNSYKPITSIGIVFATASFFALIRFPESP